MMPKTHRVLGQLSVADRSRIDYTRRGTRQEQGYTNEWLAAAKAFRAEHPLCRMCMEQHGRVTPAQCVDHIIPHRGDSVLFWDQRNWQSLCNPCHNGPKRREEEAARRAHLNARAPGVSRDPG